MRWSRHVARMAEMKNAYTILTLLHGVSELVGWLVKKKFSVL